MNTTPQSISTLKVSRYTHTLRVRGGGVLYSGRTGAVLEVSSVAWRSISALFKALNEKWPTRTSTLRSTIVRHLVAGGFLVEAGVDELRALEEHYEAARRDSQFMLTILPTFGCNLACSYCFVGTKKGAMSREVQDRIVAFVEERLATRRMPSMHVDWFGGEPLLAPSVIEYLSSSFQKLCALYDVPYRAQVITNGTSLEESDVVLLTRAGVDRLQISLDGPAEAHDERRPFKRGAESSFAMILENLPKVVGRFLIRLRINVDNGNLHRVWPLLETFAQRGWLGPDTRFFPYLSRVSAFTEACSSVAPAMSSIDDFYDLQFRWMRALESYGVPIAEQGLYEFPQPRAYNCGAVGANGFVFTPSGQVHKCGLEVDEPGRAIGQVGEALATDSANAIRFGQYSPFSNPVCRECEFLPTCLGGCPRNQLEGRGPSVKENCDYYKKYEERILLFHLGHRESAALG